MSRVNDYRRAMNGLRPSLDWRRRTLAAMEEAAAGTRRARPARHPLRWAAAAAVFVAVFLGAVWWNLPRQGTVAPIHTPGVARTPAPAYTPPDDVWFLPDAAYWLGSTFSMTYFPSDRTADPDAGRYLDAFPSLPVYDNRTTGLDDARPIGQWAAGALGTAVVSDSWDAGEGCGRYQAVLADGSELTLQGRTDLHVELPPGADAGTVQRALEALNTPAGESELEQEFLAEALLDMSYAEDLSYCDCTVIPEAYTRHSIRPAEEAVALFRSGDYWSAMHTAYPERAEILEVRLTYLTEPYMEQLQPVYAIYFTQDYWEVYEDGTNWMGADYAAWPAGMIPAAVAYVPAVEGLTFQYRSDEGRDLHRTPAVTDDVWSLSDAGGWITIVEDPAQQMGGNPTQGRLDELTELPVYYNQKPTEGQQTIRMEALAGELGLTITSSRWYEGTAEPSQGWSPSLWADCADGSTLRLNGLYSLDLLGDAPPPEALYGLYDTAADTALWSTETAEAYSFDGTQSISRIWFYDDPGASLEQQLYNYSFLRFSTTESGGARLMLPPAYIWDTYPIRTAAEAVAQFRSGDYWSTMETAYPERAEILQVTLEYAAEDYQAFFQPVYRILFTQDYWDAYLAEWMGDGADASRFTGVAAAYVPAVDGLDFRMYANDTEVHRTPS